MFGITPDGPFLKQYVILSKHVDVIIYSLYLLNMIWLVIIGIISSIGWISLKARIYG